MALPCCPPFAQGGLRSASGPVAGQPYCAPALGNRAKAGCVHLAKTAPLCKGSCRRTPTEGLRAPGHQIPHLAASIIQAVECRQSPLAWLCHAVPPLHKGGCGVPPVRWPDGHTALPRWAIEPRPVVCWASLSPGKRNRPFPWHWVKTASKSLPGDGLSHPEHPGPQRIPTGDRNGSSGTLVVFAIFLSFFGQISS